MQLQEWKSEPVLTEVPVPVPGPGEVLVQVGAAGACHSDLHLMHEFEPGTLPWDPPFTLGHEIGAVIVEKGDEFTEDFMGKPLNVGSKVMIPPLMPCGH